MRTRLLDILSEDPRIAFGYLFGSRAKGSERPDSDVDVAVWLDVDRARLGEVALELAGRVSSQLGLDADVVDLNRAPLLLRHTVLRQGRLLFERDHTARVGFESRTLVEAIDFEPLRKRCAAGLVRKLREEIVLKTGSSRKDV